MRSKVIVYERNGVTVVFSSGVYVVPHGQYVG